MPVASVVLAPIATQEGETRLGGRLELIGCGGGGFKGDPGGAIWKHLNRVMVWDETEGLAAGSDLQHAR